MPADPPHPHRNDEAALSEIVEALAARGVTGTILPTHCAAAIQCDVINDDGSIDQVQMLMFLGQQNRQETVKIFVEEVDRLKQIPNQRAS